jgi:hypothetical protein
MGFYGVLAGKGVQFGAANEASAAHVSERLRGWWKTGEKANSRAMSRVGAWS